MWLRALNPVNAVPRCANTRSANFDSVLDELHQLTTSIGAPALSSKRSGSARITEPDVEYSVLHSTLQLRECESHPGDNRAVVRPLAWLRLVLDSAAQVLPVLDLDTRLSRHWIQDGELVHQSPLSLTGRVSDSAESFFLTEETLGRPTRRPRPDSLALMSSFCLVFLAPPLPVQHALDTTPGSSSSHMSTN